MSNSTLSTETILYPYFNLRHRAMRRLSFVFRRLLPVSLPLHAPVSQLKYPLPYDRGGWQTLSFGSRMAMRGAGSVSALQSLLSEILLTVPTHKCSCCPFNSSVEPLDEILYHRLINARPPQDPFGTKQKRKCVILLLRLNSSDSQPPFQSKTFNSGKPKSPISLREAR